MKPGLEAWSGKDPYVLILGTFPGENSLSVQAYYQDKSHNSFSISLLHIIIKII